MTTIVIDGLSEEEFRRSIENRLREGQPDTAIERLRALLEPYSGEGRAVPERFLTVTANDLSLGGWDGLADAIQRHGRFGCPVTALSIAFGWPGEAVPVPDAQGWLRPYLETSYFTDDAFPFSQSGRDDLLDGYSTHGCTWAADCEGTDHALSLEGIDDLHGALAGLEARLLASSEPDEDGIRAGSLGACLLSVLLYQAVRDRIARDGLPRPLCVMAGSNGVYPYFDAPVVGMPEDPRKAAVVAVEDTYDRTVPGPRYSSLLMTRIPAGRKRAVLVLDESEAETATRLAKLRGMGLPELNPAPDRRGADLPAPGTPAAAPAGPLLAKKQARPAWDFRDMLGARAPGSHAGAPLVPEPPRPPEPPKRAEPPKQTEPPEPPAPIVPEVAADWPLPLPPVITTEPLPEPGFALLEPTVEARLHALIAAQLAPVVSAPEPEAGPEIEIEHALEPEPDLQVAAALENSPIVEVPASIPESVRPAAVPPVPSMLRARFVVAEPEAPPPGRWRRLRAWLRHSFSSKTYT